MLGGFLFVLYQALREIGGWASGTVSCLVFVTTFGLAHLVSVGNHKFVCPYSEDTVHRLVLGIDAEAGCSPLPPCPDP